MRKSIQVIFMTIVFCCLSFSMYSQDITLKMSNVTVKEAISALNKLSGYSFVYAINDLDTRKIISVSANKKRINEVVEQIIIGQNVTYRIKEKNIIISPLKATSDASQNFHKLTGQVTDEKGGSITGVVVKQKDTKNVAITDINGNFSINVPLDAILDLKILGYKPMEYKTNAQSEVRIVLSEEVRDLDEVVVIGYGTLKKTDLTGSVATVDGKNMAKIKSPTLTQSLQGSMSGVSVTRSSSAPGASGTIRVRGITTIGESDPLIIVDGVPVSNIDDVNSNDVESISVLKDAASASIYGARAAAGVILVTTKRAKSGQMGIEYNGSFGIEKPTRFPEVVNVTRYLQMMNEMTWNDAKNPVGGDYAVYSEEQVNNWLQWSKENPNQYPNTDWAKMLINEYAPKQSHQLTASYGGENIKSHASINYENTDGIYDYRNYQKLNVRLNNRFTVGKHLSANVDFSVLYSENHSPSVNPIETAYKYPAIYAATWADGRIAEGKGGGNMYARLHYGGFEDVSGTKLAGTFSMEYKPIKDLTITGLWSPSLFYQNGKDFNKQISIFDADDPDVFLAYVSGAENTSLYEERSLRKMATKQLLANYSTTISEHDLNMMAGYEDYTYFNETLAAHAENFVVTEYPYLDLGPIDNMQNSGNATHTAYRSFFGRIIYDYNNKYYGQANIRYDGSSRFHPDYRWAAFPSFSAGWAISKESFMQDFSALSFLKLRASWGTLGNERIGNYPYQSLINYSNTLFREGGIVSSSTTAAQVDYAIPDISWETTETWDIGLDASFFDNRLTICGDYYDKMTKGMLLELEIPDYMGYGNPQQNAGKMYTKGWEFQIGWKDNLGKLGYSVNFNLSDYKSVMGNLGGIVFTGNQIIKEGSEYYEWYGYVSDGLYQTQEEVDKSATLSATVKPGDVKYVDISGPNGIPDGVINADYDKVLLGGSLPRYQYGGNLSLDYKAFDMFVAFQGVGKQNARLSVDMVEPFQTSYTTPTKVIEGKYWSPYNTEEQNLNAKYPRLSYQSATNNYQMSDFWLMSGAYFRLKNITIGYTIPKKLIEKAGLSNLRIYASGTDLFSLDNYPQGWDPESASNAYISRSFSLGLSVKF